ncbi:hypothetical protein N9L68_03130 [bacterium]|nr:hypothetical protein [bacterium]
MALASTSKAKGAATQKRITALMDDSWSDSESEALLGRDYKRIAASGVAEEAGHPGFEEYSSYSDSDSGPAPNRKVATKEGMVSEPAPPQQKPRPGKSGFGGSAE